VPAAAAAASGLVVVLMQLLNRANICEGKANISPADVVLYDLTGKCDWLACQRVAVKGFSKGHQCRHAAN